MRLPRKTRRHPIASLAAGLPRTSVKVLQSAAPAAQNEPEVLQVKRLPGKTRRRPNASLVPGLPRTSVKVLQSATPATQNEPEVLQVMRLPRKTRRRPNASLVPALLRTSVKVLQVLHPPRKPNLRCFKCCTCHAKRAGDAPSAAPATQNKSEVLQVLHLPRKTRRRPNASLVAGLPRTSVKVLVMLC